jgi:hypothetical protein
VVAARSHGRRATARAARARRPTRRRGACARCTCRAGYRRMALQTDKVLLCAHARMCMLSLCACACVRLGVCAVRVW